MVVVICTLLPNVAGGKTLIDYFQPVPVVGKLVQAPWGASNVQPRDQDNGLEDKTLKSWTYWDGKIIKAADGKFHLFASRWAQSAGHGGWFGSEATHAVSASNVLGPYVEQGNPYTNPTSGHNVTAAQLPDGTFCIMVSETRKPAVFYTATSLDGPWKQAGTLKIDTNGFSNVDVSGLSSNTTMTVGPDGTIAMTARRGVVISSTTGLLGTYKVLTNSVWPNMTGYNNGNAEDPVIWYSGGLYHIVFNYWDAKKAFHLASKDLTKWTNLGLAYDPTQPFIRYTDGTLNKWTKLERPGVYIENGHVTHFTFAAIDVEKEQDKGNDSHGSKIIVVPFDGISFDNDNCSQMGLGASECGGSGVDAGGGGQGGTGGSASGGAGGTSNTGTGRGGAGGSTSGAGGTSNTGTGGSSAGAGGSAGSTAIGAGGAAGGAGQVSSGGRGGAGASAGATGRGGSDGGKGGTSSTGSGGAGTGGRTSSVDATGGQAGGASTSSGTGGVSDTGGRSGNTGTGSPTTASGCSCGIRGNAGSSPAGLLLLLGLALLRSRKRK